MPPDEEEWSDSEEEFEEDSPVQLGVPDGPVESSADILDPVVSRIGGLPAFFAAPTLPPFESSQCKRCSNLMQMLLQIWCPFENSPNDRILYIWGCARGECQREKGSVRAWRALRFNQKYALKLERRQARQLEKEKAFAAAEAARKKAKDSAKVNPFSLKAPAGAAGGLGSSIFDDDEEDEKEDDSIDEIKNDVQDFSDSDDEGEVDALVEALASSSLEDSFWKAAPAYSPLYLSTVSEEPPAKSKVSIPKESDIDDEHKAKDNAWLSEGYENSLDIDHTFERFTRRIEPQGEQCLRYDLGGTPLPFGSDDVFETIFPVPKPTSQMVTKSAFVVPKAGPRRVYDASSVPRCSHCGGGRVFECQLMPNLISMLKSEHNYGDVGSRKQSQEERRRELEELLKSSKGGMEWGTCLIFSCEKDCGGEEGANGWFEEVVLVQWDT
ncbi:programmed cell death protein 2 [Abortiporus biennis]|nr:programmed cell death protein 2 [Abortiporus biennis]